MTDTPPLTQPLETVIQAPDIDVTDKAALRGGGNQS